MDINKEKDEVLTVKVSGRLDVLTAPDLEKELQSSLDGVKALVFDLSDLTYISSAGIRVLLATQKNYGKQIKVMIRNTSPDIMAIFKMTGITKAMDVD